MQGLLEAKIDSILVPHIIGIQSESLYIGLTGKIGLKNGYLMILY